MAWCETNRVDFLFGLARNERLEAAIKPELMCPRLLFLHAATQAPYGSSAAREFAMHSKLIHQSSDGQRTFVVVLETGDEVASQIKAFADRENLKAAQLTAIGAFSDAVLGYFDWEQKQYRRTPVNEQVEVAAFIGDIALSKNDERSLHVHVVLGRRDATALAGHLMEAHVRPTLEVILTEHPAHLRKRRDPESGLALIDPRE